jgi:hypothetical protein
MLLKSRHKKDNTHNNINTVKSRGTVSLNEATDLMKRMEQVVL